MMTTATTLRIEEGTVPFRAYKTAYRIVGDPTVGTPLLVLHGGPGVPHDYLRPLDALAAPGRAVVYYDQLGTGRSSRPQDAGLWTLESHLNELENLRGRLGLGRVHLMGHSWGGILALEHVLRAPKGVAGLVLSDTTASMPFHARELLRLRSALPLKVQEALERHEKAGTTHDPAYEEATMDFLARHVCRLDPWPDALVSAFGAMNQAVYGAMWGSEVRITGTLRDWTALDRLGGIRTPTLIVSGAYDEMTPREQEKLHAGIAASEQVLLPASAHLPMHEEAEAYLAAVRGFLDKI
jgi:proline-specific peptidase